MPISAMNAHGPVGDGLTPISDLRFADALVGVVDKERACWRKDRVQARSY